MILSISPRRAFAVRSVQYVSSALRFVLCFSRLSRLGADEGGGVSPPFCGFVISEKIFCKNGKVAAPPGVKPSSLFSPLFSGFIRLPNSDSMASICSSVMPIFSIRSFTGLIPNSLAQTRQRPFVSCAFTVGEINTTAGRLWHLEHIIILQSLLFLKNRSLRHCYCKRTRPVYMALPQALERTQTRQPASFVYSETPPAATGRRCLSNYCFFAGFFARISAFRSISSLGSVECKSCKKILTY